MTISVQGLTASYPGPSGEAIVALRDVSFDVESGERVAVIGRSGSGKTTLLRVLAGLVPPASGRVEVCGRTVAGEQSREYYHDVGVVFQDHGLVRQMTPLQNVLCGALHRYSSTGALARFSRDDRQQAESYLRKLGLGSRLGVRSARLSGGEKQRVGIARLLVQSPHVMLLDEPVASLDVHWAKQVMDLISETGGEDSTCITIMHDLQIAREWATRILVIQDGQLLYDGDPEEACALLESRGGMSERPSADTGSEPAGDTTESASESPVEPADAPGIGRAPFYVLVGVALIALYIWAAIGVDLEASKIFGGLGKAADFLGRMVPPDTSVVPTVGASIVETVQMALLGTTFAAIIGLPLSMAAARNVAPVPIRATSRLILNTMRTIPSIIWGLFFVAIVGLGPFPGILALTFYATGYLGKFYYEGIEQIDPKPLTALRATGASRLHRFRWGVFPQVLPLLAGYTLYMFEYNVRAASILGVVGAGGVGFYLYSYINNFTYTKATTALLMLLVLVTVIDAASSRLREKLVV